MRTNLGLVVKNCGSTYLVKTDSGETIECMVKGNFRLKGIKSTSPVAVGDRVELAEPTLPGAPVFIKNIGERRNYIIRRSSNLSKQSHILAANVDLCLLVVTLKDPETSTVFIDRFLASAQAYRIPVIIVFNKIDLLDSEGLSNLDQLCGVYNRIGYETILCSVRQLRGIERIKSVLSGNITLLAGNSGVGKSSLANAILPGLNLKTGEISDKHNTGMHTTTFSEMYQFDCDGGWIIDTPGVKGFGVFDMDKYELPHYFPEMFELSSQCRYGDCSHTNEPGCAVLEAIRQGDIAVSRYESYLSILEEFEQSKYRESER